MNKLIYGAILSAISLLVFTSCGGNDIPKPVPESIQITSQDNVNCVHLEETLQLHASVYPSDANQEVSWYSSSLNIGSINENGLFTPNKVGNVVVTATSKVNGNIHKDFSLEVLPKREILPESIQITSEDNKNQIIVGESLKFTAKVLPNEAEQSVTWSCSPIQNGNIDTNGNFISSMVGDVIITATSKKNINIHNDFNLKILPVPVIEPENIIISVEGDIKSLYPKQTLNVSASVIPSDASQDVIFSLSNNNGFITQDGLFTTSYPGDISIIVSSRDKPSVFSSYDLLIKELPDDPLFLTKSTELTKLMGMGFNYGNAFENSMSGYPTSDYANSIIKELGCVYPDGSLDTESFIEMRQGQPAYRGAVTESTIKTIYDKGFRTIRLPISWSEHFDADGLTIKDSWFKKIEKVIDYCQKYDDLFLIINLMDCGAHRLATLDPNKKTGSLFYFHNVWTQVAERFKNYDSRLIFESINEPLFNDVWAPNINDQIYKDAVNILETMNQDFVDICRDGISNNDFRFLMVTSYGCMAPHAYNGIFHFPVDSADHKLLLSIHNYNPHSFTHVSGTSKKSLTYDDTTYAADIANSFKEVEEKIVKKLGIGVVLGEWGSSYLQESKQKAYGISKDENVLQRKTYAYRVVSEAIKHNCVPVVWDNSKISQEDDWCESFSYLNRHKASGIYDKMTNLSGVQYDNENLWFFECILDSMFEAYQQFK